MAKGTKTIRIATIPTRKRCGDCYWFEPDPEDRSQGSCIEKLYPVLEEGTYYAGEFIRRAACDLQCGQFSNSPKVLNA